MTNRSPQEIKIASGHNSATILPHHGGSVLHLIFANESGQKTEQLWHRHVSTIDTGTWPDGGIPILFPFGGRVWCDNQVGKYRHGNQVYEMPIHGFLYGLRGKILEQETSRVILEFSDNEMTQSKYPWKFKLTICYEIEGACLRIRPSVVNLGFIGTQGSRKMPMSLGFHPYFALPEPLKIAAKDLTLDLSAKRSFRVTPVGGKGEILSPGPIYQIALDNKAYQNAILEMDPHKAIYLSGKKQGTRIVLRTEGSMNYLVLWGETESRFFCVEPWMAPPDAPHHQEGTCFLDETHELNLSLSISEEYFA